jgi:glutamate formiminotransferase/formiminotetrahydrofolate cyclodeaminase
MNVRINASGVNDKEFVEKLISEGREIEKAAEALEREIVALVDEKIK